MGSWWVAVVREEPDERGPANGRQLVNMHASKPMARSWRVRLRLAALILAPTGPQRDAFLQQLECV